MIYLWFYLGIQILAIEADLWNKHYLTYSIENDHYNPKLIKEAIQEWNIEPILEFKHTERGQGDIKIYFKPLSSAVGLSYPPQVGIINIHSNIPDILNVSQIFQHEFGHALGLKHSTTIESIMHHTLVPPMHILKSDKQQLKELYQCRYDSVTLLNGYTYLKFRGRHYERIDRNTENFTNDTLWHPEITRVTAMYRDENYFILSDDKYFEFNDTMQLERIGFIADKFPNISDTISAVLTLNNGTMMYFLKNKRIWYNNLLMDQNIFEEFPDSPIQGAYSDFNFIYLVSRDNLYKYDEDFNFLNKTRLCDDSQLRKIHCCNEFSNIPD